MPLNIADNTIVAVDCDEVKPWNGSPLVSRKPDENVPLISVNVIFSGSDTASYSLIVPAAPDGCCTILAPTVKL